MVKYKILIEALPSEYSKVIYGDSVTGDTPLLLKKDDKIYIKTIKDIFGKAEPRDYQLFKSLDSSFRTEKEYSLSDFQIWSKSGWSKIKKVIRHKCDKKIVKILTHSGFVKVTEDHSLLTPDGSQIKPSECDIGTGLLTSYPLNFPENSDTISKYKAYLYGFFYGDGSCGFYECNSGNNYSWALNNPDLDLLNKLMDILYIEYPDNKFTIYDTMESSGVYKLSSNCNKMLVEEFRSKFYDDEQLKKVPDEILNSDNKIIQSFFDGYFAADGCRKDKEKIGCIRFDNKGQIGTAGLYFLTKKLGYNVSLNTRIDKNNIFRTNITKKNLRKASNKIKKIQYTDKVCDYVYDIETGDGTFQAGIGDIIVKNTDSCMVELNTKALIEYKKMVKEYISVIKLTDTEQDLLNKLKTKAIEEAFVQGKVLANEVTKALFKSPINLEFEKVYTNFLILSKKRYLGNYYGKDPYTIDMVEKKGVVLKRRDNPDIVKKIYSGVINPLLEHGERGVQISVDFLKSELKKLMNNDVNLDDLVVTKSLAKGYGKINQKTGELIIGDGDYKNTNLPHVSLALKMRDRDPGSAPNVGDRISYVLVEIPGNPKAKLYEKSESPDVVKEKRMKIDYLYYITNQIHNPVNEILKILIADSESIFTEATKEYQTSRQEEIRVAKIKSKIPKGQTSILEWIRPKDSL